MGCLCVEVGRARPPRPRMAAVAVVLLAGLLVFAAADIDKVGKHADDLVRAASLRLAATPARAQRHSRRARCWRASLPMERLLPTVSLTNASRHAIITACSCRSAARWTRSCGGWPRRLGCCSRPCCSCCVAESWAPRSPTRQRVTDARARASGHRICALLRRCVLLGSGC